MGLGQDIRHALRRMRLRPAVSLIVISTLGIGIGANGIYFASLYGSALRPLPFEEPERLVMLHQSRPEMGETRQGVSALNLRDWMDSTSLFVGAGAFVGRDYNLQSSGEPVRIVGSAIDARLFPLLGVEPFLGRNLRAEDDRPGGPRVALISHQLWRERFRSDPRILERSLRLDGTSHRIVGVMPVGFHFSHSGHVWTPLQLDPDSERRDALRLSVIARLLPGVGIEGAQAALGAVARELATLHPDTNSGRSVEVYPLREAWMPSGGDLGRLAVIVQMVLVTGLLLIVCSNVANVVLAQATGRRQEQALRAVLGAGRARLARQALVETGLLAVAGGLVGTAIALWSDVWLKSILPIETPYWLDLSLEIHGLLYIAAVTLGAGLVIGLLPALGRSERHLFSALRGGGRDETPGSIRLRRALVIAEYAIALVILVAGLLMVRSFEKIQGTDRGFATDSVLTLRLPLTGEAYERARDRTAFLETLLRGLDGLDETSAVGVTDALPYLQLLTPAMASLDVEGLSFAPAKEPRAAHHSVSAGYFAALSIPLLAGRTFTPSEVSEGADAVLISASIAESLWPGESPLHRRLRTRDPDPGPWLEVVGVVGDIEPGQMAPGLGNMPWHRIYLPLAGTATPSFFSSPPRMPSLVLGSRSDAPMALLPAVRQLVRELDPGLPLFEVRTMAEVLDQFFFVQHFWSRIFSAIAFLALVIAAIGVYGIMAYVASRRSREVGVRMALGASPRQVLTLLLHQGLTLASIGIGVGLLLAVPLSHAMESLLHGVTGLDPVVFVQVAVLLLGIGLIASLLPARKAAATDPVATLRSE